MSSSDKTSYIALRDSPEEAARKIRKYAFSGGQATLEEHRKKGGNPDVGVAYQMLFYQMLLYVMENDDKKLKMIYDNYISGKLLTGELKQLLIDKMTDFLKEHQEKIKNAEKVVDQFLN